MNNKLSKREKIMIYAMILVVIAGLGFMAIKQLVNRYYDAQEAYESASMERMMAEEAVTSLPLMQQQVDELTAYCEDNQVALAPAISNPEMEQIVLGYVTDCGLTVNSSSILSAYDYLLAAENRQQEQGEAGKNPQDDESLEETESEDASDTLSEGEAEDTSADMSLVGEDGTTIDGEMDETQQMAEADAAAEMNTESLFLTSDFQLELEGTYGNFCDFLDFASEQLDIEVSSYSVFNEAGAVVYDLSGTESYVYYVSVSFFMQTQDMESGADPADAETDMSSEEENEADFADIDAEEGIDGTEEPDGSNEDDMTEDVVDDDTQDDI